MNDITREDFMAYYRSDKYVEELTVDDKIEVFLTSLPGSSDITYELLTQLCAEYGVDFDEIASQ